MLVLLVPGVGMGGGTTFIPPATVFLHVGLSRGVISATVDAPGTAD